MRSWRPYRLILTACCTLALLALGARLLLPGFSSARGHPSRFEEAIATRLLRWSVPAAERARTNPLGAEPANVLAGRRLYGERCAQCHGYDGSGRTLLGSGEYPRPPMLRSAEVQSLTDGELRFHIRNGIRNTAMPAFDLADEQLWQLVAFLRQLPQVAPLSNEGASSTPASAQFVGSAACASCHAAIYERWKKSRMANVVRDPREHPDAILPDLSRPDPLVHFQREDIAFVYGSRWKQRYFQKVGDEYYPLPAQWDIAQGKWRPYHVANGTDWWTAYYPADNAQRPTGPLCDGCHSVGYDIVKKTVAEWNVGCERCHGAGSEHARSPTAANIINPARLDLVRGNDTCLQCHSQGRPVPSPSPMNGGYYDWPVGYQPGARLSDVWQFEGHKPGQGSFTHFADGTAHKNRMQGNDYVTSLMYARGITCFGCHDPHGSDNEGSLRQRSDQLCLGCHGPGLQNGPRAATLEQHTHHAAGSAGSSCIACHMPTIAQTIADSNVRSHTFRFVTPSQTEALGVPNACNVCHADRTTAWASAALRTWSDRSPWRVAE